MDDIELEEKKNQLVLEMMALAYAVDRDTPYAVFIDYSGHVEQLSIKIVESKDLWDKEIVSTKFYTNKKYDDVPDQLKWLTMKRDHLKQILDDGEVDYCAMTQTVEHVYHHSF